MRCPEEWAGGRYLPLPEPESRPREGGKEWRKVETMGHGWDSGQLKIKMIAQRTSIGCEESVGTG